MATTSNLSRLLRTPVLRRKATKLLQPHHHTSPPSFLHSHSDHHLLSTFISRRMHTWATPLRNPRSPRSIWPYALTLGCIATGGMMVFYKLREKKSVPELTASLNDELEIRFQGSVPDLYRKGHSVVVEGMFRPTTDSINSNAVADDFRTKRSWEFNLLATEVLAQPQEVAAALERNYRIFAEKQKVSDDKEQHVSDDEENILEVEEKQKDAVNWYKTPREKISESATDLSNSNSEGRVDQSALAPEVEFRIIELLRDILDTFQDIPDVLQEGHSVFIEGFVKQTADEMKEDKLDDPKNNKLDVMKANKSDEMMKRDESEEFDAIKEAQPNEMKEDKLDDTKEAKWTDSVTGKTKENEYHVRAEAVAKHDERYMPKEVAPHIG